MGRVFFFFFNFFNNEMADSNSSLISEIDVVINHAKFATIRRIFRD